MQFITEAIQAQAEKILQAKSEGQSTTDILAQVYVDRLPDKTPAQGRIMAEGILKEIGKFDEDYKFAQDDREGFITNSLENMNSGKTCAQRCTFLLQVSAAVSADLNSDKDEIMRNIQSLSVSDEEATPEREQELMAQAAEAIKNSPIMLSAFMKHSEELENLQSSDNAAGLLIDFGKDEKEYRAILSMLVYTSIKNGEVEGVPIEMTAAQVTAAVCGEIEQMKIAEAVQSGSLAVDIASMLLFILGTVVMIHFFMNIAVIFSLMVLNTFTLLFAVPGVLMVIAGTMKLFNKSFEAWKQDSKRIVNAIVFGVKFVISGLKAIADFVSSSLMPKLENRSSDVKAGIPVMSN